MNVKAKKSNSEKDNYYVNPADFKQQLKAYYDTNVMTEILGENLKKIAYGLSYHNNFKNYTWKDDMVGDALIKMYAALKFKKYKFKKETNPFSYFNTIAFHAFINRIKKEKKHQETLAAYKEKTYEDLITTNSDSIYVKPVHDSDHYDFNNVED